MALTEVHHGSERSPSGWNIASRSKSQSPQVTHSSQSHDGLLTEPPTPTDFSQSHDKLLAEQCWSPGKAMTNFSQTRGLVLRFKN